MSEETDGFTFQRVGELDEPLSPKLIQPQKKSSSVVAFELVASSGEARVASKGNPSAAEAPLSFPASIGEVEGNVSERERQTVMEDEAVPSVAAGRRGKVPLEKGYSQVDWLRVMNSGLSLGPRRKIKMDEVKKHRTEQDCWTVLHGRVYNIAPYLRYHPGGVDILMKGAGRDCTALFNKYHAWVNFDFLLSKCLIGILDVESG